jgi:hypothetical protein
LCWPALDKFVCDPKKRSGRVAIRYHERRIPVGNGRSKKGKEEPWADTAADGAAGGRRSKAHFGST